MHFLLARSKVECTVSTKTKVLTLMPAGSNWTEFDANARPSEDQTLDRLVGLVVNAHRVTGEGIDSRKREECRSRKVSEEQRADKDGLEQEGAARGALHSELM